MAETPVEVVIRARNEAQAALNQAVGQLRQLETQAKQAGRAGATLAPLRDALGTLSPAANQAASQIAMLARAGAGLGPIGVAAGAVAAGLGLLAGAATVGAKALADQVEQLQNLAAMTGASTRDIQVLQELFKRQGLSADAATTALHRLNVAIGEGNPLLAKLGVTARDPMEALLQLSDAFRTSTDAGARAKVAQDLLGRSSRDLLAAIDNLRAGFPPLRAEMESTSQALSEDMVEAGARFDQSWERFTGRWEGFMNRMRGAAAVAANAIIDAFQRATPEQAFEKQVQGLEDHIKRMRAMLAAAKLTFQHAQAAEAAGQLALLEESASGAAARIAALRQEILRAEGQLAILRNSAGKFANEEGAAFNKAVAAGRDLLAEATKKQEKATAALREHNARVRELVDLFGLQRTEAERIIDAEERLDRDRRKRALRKELFEPKPIEGIEVPGKRPEAPEATKVPDVGDVLAEWRGALNQMATAAAAADAMLRGVLAGLEGFFNTLFTSLLSDATSFTTAMRNAFRAMVNAILAELARLAAIKLLSLLLGGPLLPTKSLAAAASYTPPTPLPRAAAPATAPGMAQQQLSSLVGMMRSVTDRMLRGVATFVPPAPASRSAMAVGAALAGMQAPVPVAQGNTFNIYGYDNFALVQQLTSPAGTLRRAHDRLAAHGAY